MANRQCIDKEFFSGTGSREVPDRTLFVVGDRKQSIFSFQGANPAAFEASREIFGTQITNVGQPFSTVDLTISYRSTMEVLKAVDMVFAEGMRARVGLDGIHPQNLHHHSNRGGEQDCLNSGLSWNPMKRLNESRGRLPSTSIRPAQACANWHRSWRKPSNPGSESAISWRSTVRWRQAIS